MFITLRRDSAHARISSLLAALVLGTGGTLLAQDADFIAITKTQNFEQVSPYIVTLLEEDFSDPEEAPFVFEVFAEAYDVNLLTSGSLDRPSGLDLSLTVDGGGEELFLSEGFELFSEMNRAFGDGSYEVNLVGVNDGMKSATLDLPAPTFVGVPSFTNYTAAQSIQASSNFTFQWEPIPGGTANDLAFLSIEDDFGSVVFESPDIGEAGQLTGLSTSGLVPAGTLSSGTDYYAYLDVFTIVDSNESYAPGVPALAGYGKSTLMEFRTSGPVADFLSPSLDQSFPFDFQREVELNTIVTFVFNEEMDTSVNVGPNVTWTGVSNPALFDYSWSPDGRTLFCHYQPGLPASATIEWTLNSTGAVDKLQDLAGNILGRRSGQFETSATSNLGTPDVSEFDLIKGKCYYQDGDTPIDLESYFAEFFVGMTGISTVSSVDLGIPGRGTAVNLGAISFNNDEIEGEALYAEKADLDRIFPNGDYVVTMHTFHDGEQNVTLTLGPDDYPNAPRIQNFAATQTIDGSQPYTLQWDSMAGGTSSDFIEVILEGESACYFESPFIGEPGALDGTDTEVTIPADILPPGRTLQGELVFIRIIDTEDAAYPGAVGRTAFVTITEFEVQTTGDPFEPQLEIQHNGAQITVKVIGEVGRQYELWESDDLGDLDPWTPVWTGFLFGDCDGFKSFFEYFDNVSGVPKRFYQARELPFGP